jgi:hypothetical protein
LCGVFPRFIVSELMFFLGFPHHHVEAQMAKAHPGFKVVEAKIAKEPGVRNAGAVLAASTRKASAKAKKANPRLKRVKPAKRK